MKILHIIDSLAIGGAERMLAVLANAFHKAGHEVAVCATRCGGGTEALIDRGIPIHVLGRRSRYDLRGLVRFCRLVKEKNFDILHVHGRSTGAFVAVAKIMWGIPGAVVLHDHYSVHLNAKVPLTFRLLTKSALGLYVGVSKEHLCWSRSAGIPSESAWYIVNALPLSHTKLEIAQAKDQNRTDGAQLVGVCIGGIRREKGTLELIEAVSKLKTIREFRINVMGGIRDRAYYEECLRAVSVHGVGSAIQFLGEVPEAAYLLRESDFAVIPSLSESGPLVLIEAMLAGIPFVCTRTGGVAEAAAHAGIEEFVEPGNVDALARGIERLLKLSTEQRRERGEKAREFAEKEFNIERWIPEWIALYEKALALRA